jgi:8-oxo-dGTP diphosphatase
VKPILTTLIYCRRENHVLLVQRQNEPFRGFWVAPGGKIEPGESPRECARRELREETGLEAPELTLRAIVTETSNRPDWQWMLFIYLTQSFRGRLARGTREGELRWWRIDETKTPIIPESDAIFFPRILASDNGVYEARYEYDTNLRLVHVVD